MYRLDEVRRGLRRGLETPAFFGRELNRLYHRRLYRAPYNRRGVDVFAEPWDNLLLLDACRYDDFADLSDLPGELEVRESRGSHTIEFLEGNVVGRELLETVYVTGSPQLHASGFDGRFHAVENVWDGDGWDDDLGTVRPETMAERALAAVERYPDKRLFVHFVQPHYPFIEDGSLVSGTLKDEAIDVWERRFRGEIGIGAGTLRAAYRRNLRLVLAVVGPLLTALPGLTVVTADHGNMFGERSFPVPIREWGHPPGQYTDQLVRVPWHVYGDERRPVTAEAPERTDDAPTVDPTDRLRQLGYLD